MSEKISITRGLRELKLLDERILKTTDGLVFVDVFQGRNPNLVLATKKQKPEFESQVKEKLQSLKDLTRRRELIKSSIMKSNSETKVIIGGKEYFVIDAIEKKNSVKYDKILLEKMKKNYNAIKSQIEVNKLDLENKIEAMLNQSLGTEKKVTDETYKNIATPMLEANELKLVDPIGIEKEIERLDKEISDFEAEVDFVLSESNSRTEIEV